MWGLGATCFGQKLQRNNFILEVSLHNFLSELNNIFPVKDLKRLTFYVKIFLIEIIHKKKNIKSLNLSRKVILLNALT